MSQNITPGADSNLPSNVGSEAVKSWPRSTPLLDSCCQANLNRIIMLEGWQYWADLRRLGSTRD